MKELKNARALLKALGEDTRLRIINLLTKQGLNVAQLCEILDSPQSNVSKHLTRLRYAGIVVDKRKGQLVYYFLSKTKDHFHNSVLQCISRELGDIPTFKHDLEALKKMKKTAKRPVLLDSP